MNAESALALLLGANQLKRVQRTGWVMRGIANAETVSDHSFGVAFIALVLAQYVDEPIDTVKLITTALIHDLPEAVLSDIPSPACLHLPRQSKTAAERSALSVLLDEIPQGERWQDWWRDFAEQSSVEARLVDDADRLDLLLQAYVYEQTTGNRWLEEFWSEPCADSFAYPISRSIFDELCETRAKAMEDMCAG